MNRVLDKKCFKLINSSKALYLNSNYGYYIKCNPKLKWTDYINIENGKNV